MSFYNFVTMGKLFNLSLPQSPHLKLALIKVFSTLGCCEELNLLIYAKHLDHCQL